MTSIEYLSLEGIRAFSPHPDAQQRPKQQLKFLKPLTIILGANGAGVPACHAFCFFFAFLFLTQKIPSCRFGAEPPPPGFRLEAWV